MRKLVLALAIIIGFSQCQKQEAEPQYQVKLLYSGDSVRYNLDSLPVAMPIPPSNYNDYYTLVHLYSNRTMTVDVTHILKHGMSETFRGFVRFDLEGHTDFKGWYKRRIVNGYIIPTYRNVAVYHTMPYDKDFGPIHSDDDPEDTDNP